MNSLDQLIAPINIDDFFRHYWHRLPLHIPGAAQKFARFPGISELPAIGQKLPFTLQGEIRIAKKPQT